MLKLVEVYEFPLISIHNILVDVGLSTGILTLLILLFLVLLMLVLVMFVKIRANNINNEIIAIQAEKLKKETQRTQAYIEYAKSIQDSFLSRDCDLVQFFPSASVFRKSKDILSGDLFFIKKIRDSVVLATIDCSGHGVPGAFMSLIAHQSLSRVVEFQKILEPNKILYELHQEVVKSIGKNIKSDLSKEGMDVSLCVINTKTGSLKFSGARSSMFILRGKDLIELKGNLISIGGMFESYIENNNAFDSVFHDLKFGDKLFMFSDGVMDQFGGETGKKLNKQGLKNMIQSYKGDSSLMAGYIDNFMKEWMNGRNPQVDDMLFLNVEIS